MERRASAEQNTSVETRAEAPAKRGAPVAAYLLGALGVVAGVVAFGVAVSSAAADQAWRALLVNVLFWTSIASGALAWAVAFRITRTTWSAPVNRIGHSFIWYLPFCLAMFLVLLIGRRALLPWIGMNLGDVSDWLNVPFVFARNGVGLLALIVLGWIFVSTYLRAERREEDEEQDAAANRRLSVVGVIFLFVYGIELTILGFDFVMSLMPDWYSSLLGWYFLLGSAYSGVAALAVMTVARPYWLGGRPVVGKVPRRYLGSFVLAFAMAMTYFFYSQALPIWYENLPHEIVYAIPRLHILGWRQACLIIVLSAYLGVFFLFIVREMREIPATLVGVSLFALAGMWLERYVLVVPSLTPLRPVPPWLVVLIGLGFLGVLLITSTAFLSRVPAASRLDLALEREKEWWR